MAKTYITNAIPYVNAKPHIGFALEAIQSDTLARYKKLVGNDVFYSFGTDENSLKNVRAAEKEGITTGELVNKYSEVFRLLKNEDVLNLSFDVFNRTSSPNHFIGAQKLWSACKLGDIYKRSYEGLYCVGCEEFYTEDELVDGKCPEHGVPPEKVSEENYFFKLTNYQSKIEQLIESDQIKIVPLSRKNEVLSFVRQGLKDFSISRSFDRAKGWGVPVPGDKSQIMYVWFDALTTYLTSLGYGTTNDELFGKYWTEDTKKIHVIGKGIIRFHAVYWIGMLLSAGLPLPNTIFVHGYVTVNGQKISKSLGNTIDPFEIVKKYGTDALRYYLLSQIPSTSDGDFSEEKLKTIYNADLANGLGNLVARVAKLCETNGYIFGNFTNSILDNYYREVREKIENYQFSDALKLIWEWISDVDISISKNKPWKKERDTQRRLLEDYVDQIQRIATALQPFLPQTSEIILEQFSKAIGSRAPLFPRIS